MKRILSGVQPSGKPHLGNYLGAMRQHIEMQKDFEAFLFIADLHALTTVRDPELMREQTFDLAVSYLALGLDPEKTVFFKQSDLSEHAELCWIFDCITQMPFVERAHAWKDAQAKGKKEISVGLFNYPVLQAADILLYQPDLVPVGQDQKQHIEMTRDIAQNFNNIFGETFQIPEPHIEKDVAVVPGTDGQKMSKSYGNTIEIFADEKTLKKQVMGIVTDSTPVEDPKDPEKCNVFTLYKLIATEEETKALEERYKKGGWGYGDAKKLLLEKIMDHFADARKKYDELKDNKDYIYEVLEDGAKRARKVAKNTLDQAKKQIGYK
ncbi:tryptophan--tRNA ligase [Candidatus Peregrinibacteria bacterium]|jgi:tryptophanyl-tRNA synthetase|nr:tryptophan--tRNA ligase [Candidatus Peregrinibacteria bacterium]MBT7736973.1 tryptophan--tRNA ligase [Candidatus Peregrinibacteria bacterium]